jgi:hypothetical protein
MKNEKVWVIKRKELKIIMMRKSIKDIEEKVRLMRNNKIIKEIRREIIVKM